METLERLSHRQIGTFSIGIDRAIGKIDLELLADIFARLKIIPFRTEMLYVDFTLQYEAVSSAFDEVEPGMKSPYYKISWRYVDDNIIDLQVKRTEYLEMSGEIHD